MEELVGESVYVDNTPEELKIIREFYRNENSSEAQEYFENELESALESKCKTIVIEPKKFGEDTARWIYIGKILEKSAILTGFSSIFSAFFLPERTIIYCPMAAFSLICTSLYSLSWSSDPCSSYRVITFEQNINEDKELKQLRELLCCDNETPIILCKEENISSQKNRNFFHRAISIIAFALSSWRFYDLVKLAQSV